MLERLTMPGVELPRLYVAENRKDAELAMSKGVPFVRWTQGKDKLIAMLLLPTLMKMFPYIKWDEMVNLPVVRSVMVEFPGSGRGNDMIDIGNEKPSTKHAGNGALIPKDGEVITSDVSSNEYRSFSDGMITDPDENSIDVSVYVKDLGSQVDLDVLQSLKLMPTFVGDIMDCIKKNVVAGTSWSEGYNKKRGATIGNFDRTGQLRNLIILDISHSIPFGVSATMLTLVDTLRTQVHADLIVTGGRSRYYPYEEELPDPQVIRNTIPLANEAVEFCQILKNNIAGNHYGHVISFGDNDCPGRFFDYDRSLSLSGTVVEHVHHYHTRRETKTGYALWCHDLQKNPIVSYDTRWCRYIKH